MNIGNLELKFKPVDPHTITENDRLAYVEGLRELIDLDAVVVASSGNIDVRHCFLPPATVTDD